MALIPLINGKGYSWASITLNVGGAVLNGFTGISYSETQEKENIYGAGDLPVERGQGNREYEGSLTLLMQDVEQLRAASPSRSLLDLPMFTIVVAYQSGAKIATHTLRNVEFTEDNADFGQGDQMLEVELSFIMSNIIRA